MFMAMGGEVAGRCAVMDNSPSLRRGSVPVPVPW